jgi:proline dehydrogenase
MRDAMNGVPRTILFSLATSERFERAVRAVPGGEQAAYRWASRYVAGTTADDAFATAHELAAQGVLSSIDLFGENVTDPCEADEVADSYVALADRLAVDAPVGTWLSIDLSHIGIDEPGDGPRRRLDRIAAALPDGARLQVGAEQAARTDRILDAVLAVARAGGPVAATVQANLRRSPADADRLAAEGVPIRLVKGAYVETPSLAHPWGDATDLAFIELAYTLHRAGATVSLATHDPVIREALLPAMAGAGVEMLLRVRPDDLPSLVARGVPVRVYVAFGERWFRYAMRRAAESRGAG